MDEDLTTEDVKRIRSIGVELTVTKQDVAKVFVAAVAATTLAELAITGALFIVKRAKVHQKNRLEAENSDEE